MLLAVLFLGVAILSARGAYSFLAVTSPVPANVLIIEGWAPPWVMIEAAELYRQHSYQHVLVVRGVLDPSSEYDLGWSTAEYGVAALIKNGVPETRIAKVVVTAVRKDRTYHSALAAKEWLATNHVAVTGLNVATVGPHARRSGLLYRKAFGPDAKMGTIALQPRAYDTRRWWRYSEGVRDLIGEYIAYIYARLLFIPD